MIKLDNAVLEEKLSELYRKNEMVRYTIELGNKWQLDNLTILAHTVIALAYYNKELQDQLLKIEMERRATGNITL